MIALAVLAPSLSAQSVDEIIAKYVQARGGADKLKSVQSIKTTATMTMGPGMELPGTVIQKRPKFARLEFTAQGLTAVQAFDGKDAWQIMPFMGKKDPMSTVRSWTTKARAINWNSKARKKSKAPMPTS
jgi:outer membrane lipoprotein-sorting protein